MYLTSFISKFLTPAGVLISTKSPLFFPIKLVKFKFLLEKSYNEILIGLRLLYYLTNMVRLKSFLV